MKLVIGKIVYCRSFDKRSELPNPNRNKPTIPLIFCSKTIKIESQDIDSLTRHHCDSCSLTNRKRPDAVTLLRRSRRSYTTATISPDLLLRRCKDKLHDLADYVILFSFTLLKCYFFFVVQKCLLFFFKG